MKSLVAYEIPEAVDVIICVLAEYIRSGKFLLGTSPFTLMRCKDTIEFPGESRRFYKIVVGGFSSAGLRVLINNYVDDDFVAGALRKF